MGIKMFITIGCFLIMGVIFAFGWKNAAKLSKYKKDFSQAKSRLQAPEVQEAVRTYLSQENAPRAELFQTAELQEVLDSYREDRLQAEKENRPSSYFNLRDYISVEKLDDMSNGGLCELVPNMMTGLGLLGTFGGLLVGIGGLETGNVEVLQNGIENMLAGMNTAFSTSIVGVALALIFSFFYRRHRVNCIHAMDVLLNAVEDYNLDSSENAPEQLTLRYQQQQTKILEGFAQTLAAENSRCILETVTPITEKMQTTIQELSDVVSEKQTEGVAKIVDAFVQSMNTTLNGQFENLKETIESTCQYQKEQMTSTRNILDEICESSTKISEINRTARETVDKMRTFMTDVNALQTEIRESVSLAKEQLADANRIHAENSEYIKQIAGYEERIANLADQMGSEARAINGLAQEFQENCAENIKRLEDSSRVFTADKHQQMQDIKEEVRDDLNEVTNAFARAAADQKEQTSREIGAVNEAIRQMASTIEKRMTEDTMGNKMDALAGKMEQSSAAVTDAVDQMKREIKGSLENNGERMERSANRVVSAVEQMGQGMRKGMVSEAAPAAEESVNVQAMEDSDGGSL